MVAKNHIDMILEIVNNIDFLDEKAKNIKISKNDFIDSLRHVTCEKIFGIKEAKKVFQNRINKLISA
jgi:hypothetical protein